MGEILKFKVRGSKGNIYTVTAEGFGEEFRMFCTCPAGRKGQPMCKHRAYFLQGDLDNFVGENTSDLAKLQVMSEGSPLLDLSDNRVERDLKSLRENHFTSTPTIEEFLSSSRKELEELGWIIDLSQDDEMQTTNLELRDRFKNGKPKKGASVILSYVTKRAEWHYDIELDDFRQVEFLSIRPWSVIKKQYSEGTWKKHEKAMSKFMEIARSLAPNKDK